MRIARIEDLHCDAGWRVFSFLKITTDDGITGWSEYNEGYGSRGLTAVIRALGERLIGQDPRPFERIAATLYAVTRQAPGGINQQAIGAIENALVDIKAKALGVPVHALFGGPVRERLPDSLLAPLLGALSGLRELHSGHTGDYIAWWTLGAALLGGASLVLLT
jgi:galactonate dehydratase